jgi:hypothetical protein
MKNFHCVSFSYSEMFSNIKIITLFLFIQGIEPQNSNFLRRFYAAENSAAGWTAGIYQVRYAGRLKLEGFLWERWKPFEFEGIVIAETGFPRKLLIVLSYPGGRRRAAWSYCWRGGGILNTYCSHSSSTFLFALLYWLYRTPHCTFYVRCPVVSETAHN